MGSQKHLILTTKYIPYTYKFSRDVNFALFAVNLSSTKFKSSKFYKNSRNTLETQGVIMTDPQKIAKILDLIHSQNLHPTKNCTYTPLKAMCLMPARHSTTYVVLIAV